MNLYEIDKRLQELVDPETGELMDYEAFEALSIERNSKIENMALWVKDLESTISAICHEENNFAERRKSLEKKRDRLKDYILRLTDGKKFSTSRCVVSFRHTKKCVVCDNFVEWAQKNGRDDLLTYKDPSVSLTAVKTALESGDNVPAEIIDNISVGVK